MSPDSSITERIRSLVPGSATALRLNPREYADDYFAVLQAIFREPPPGDATHMVFISVTNPVALVWSIAQALDVPPERISFVDAISRTMMSYREPLPNSTYVESPRMLETIMLRVDYLLRRVAGARPLVVIDSVNSLGIHNPNQLLSEFFHILGNNLKSRQAMTLLLLVSDDPTSELDQMVNLVVDETIEVVRPRG